MNNINKFIFVFNKDSSIFAQITDYVHKALKPETYLGMKREWKKFIENLPYTVEFLHRDEFAMAYPDKAATPLPAVFKNSNSLELLLSRDEINSAINIPGLKQLIS